MNYYIFDFDSTFIKVEALEELSKIVLKNNPNRRKLIRKVKKITSDLNNGEINIETALIERLKIIHSIYREHIEELISRLKSKISSSFLRNKQFFKRYSESIYIISTGFKDYIIPVLEDFGIPENNIYANEFIYDEKGMVIGVDKSNPLCYSYGKIKILQKLNLKNKGKVYVIGDGYSDYLIKEKGLADRFYVFTENVKNENVIEKADHIIPSLDEFLYINRLPMSISYPKNRIKVLLLENIHPSAYELFRKEGYSVEAIPGSLDEDELGKVIKDVSILGIRSRTNITPKVLNYANKLIAIGAFCIGTNQIDLLSCTNKGIVVFNAPFSNTRSVVELVICEIIMLMRQLYKKCKQMHNGIWEKTSKGCKEIRGKKLGILGYGNIGSQLSVIAEALGMDVIFYDIADKLPLGNAVKVKSMEELLRKSDILSIHVDGRPENRNLISSREIDMMKKGAILINTSRGFVVDLNSLKDAIVNGKLAGAAIDVFPEEPKNNITEGFINELQGFDNVILTPHIGGSTEEAQRSIAEFVPEKIISYVNTGSTYSSVNFPNIALPELKDAHRFIHIHKNVPGVLAKINSIFSKYNINIVGQYLKTNEYIGYVITDVSTKYDKNAINEIKKIPETIKFRVLY